MTFDIHEFGNAIGVSAEAAGLTIRGPRELSKREHWPADALAATGGWRTAIEIEQLLELGLAEETDGVIRVAYENFEAIQSDMPVDLIGGWTAHSPFLLKIDRQSDVGRADFQYRYAFVLAGKEVHLDRLGYYVKRAGNADVFLLDSQMYSLVEAMDAFNALPPDAKTPQESWLTFAKVKGCATEVGATLDSTLRNNDVIVPSTLGLDMKEDQDGALTFLPKCAELAREEFHQVFERNPGAEKLYTLDRPGLGRVRIVLTDEQHEVLRRMKRVRRVKGELRDRLKRDPVQVFDGVADLINLPYGERVIGIGEFKFVPVPRPQLGESDMATLWQGQTAGTPQVPDAEIASGKESGDKHSPETGVDTTTGPPGSVGAAGDGPQSDDASVGPLRQVGDDTPAQLPVPRKYLLIETNEESVRSGFTSEAETARRFAGAAAFERPQALRQDRNLHPHQERGVQWLQTCSQIPGRKGVLLADDMGVGKTVQVLTFLAWCIESGKFPDLSRREPPFRPILIVAPLILLDTRTWEKEMENFFSNWRYLLAGSFASRRSIVTASALPVELLQRLFHWQDEELSGFTRTLGPLFPVTKEANNEVIRTYHKSLSDWLANEDKAGAYFVSAKEGHELISDYGFSEFQYRPAQLSDYLVRNLPHHLLEANRWSDAVLVLATPTEIEQLSDSDPHEMLTCWRRIVKHDANLFRKAFRDVLGNAHRLNAAHLQCLAESNHATRSTLASALSGMQQTATHLATLGWLHTKLNYHPDALLLYLGYGLVARAGGDSRGYARALISMGAVLRELAVRGASQKHFRLRLFHCKIALWRWEPGADIKRIFGFRPASWPGRRAILSMNA